MFSSVHAAATPADAVPGTTFRPTEPGAIDLDALGSVEDEDHILVLGGQGPELMCALLRAGATNVTHLRAHERPEADSATLVIVPRIASLDWLATALPLIRRALTGHGRVVVLADVQPNTVTQVRRMLKLHGLTAIDTHATRVGTVVTAERLGRQWPGRIREIA